MIVTRPRCAFVEELKKSRGGIVEGLLLRLIRFFALALAHDTLQRRYFAAVTFIVAAIAGAVIGSLLFSYRRYRFWWKWSRIVFMFAILAILAVNAGFGLVGVLLAHAVKWKPWEQDWRNGLSFAVFGLALVRIRLPGLDIDRPESSIEALNVIMRWIAEMLDLVADRKIETTLANLSDQELRALVAYILARYVINDQSIDSQDRAAEVRKMKSASERLAAGNVEAWSEMLAWAVLQTRRRLLVNDRLRPTPNADAGGNGN